MQLIYQSGGGCLDMRRVVVRLLGWNRNRPASIPVLAGVDALGVNPAADRFRGYAEVIARLVDGHLSSPVPGKMSCVCPAMSNQTTETSTRLKPMNPGVKTTEGDSEQHRRIFGALHQRHTLIMETAADCHEGAMEARRGEHLGDPAVFIALQFQSDDRANLRV